MHPRFKKFISYYKPYRGLFLSVMACSFIGAGISLLLPLCTRYITKNVLEGNLADAPGAIYQMGLVMLALIGAQAISNFYYDYKGHAMGALMENDMREELFNHYQKLSFSFYDNRQTGRLMSGITNDLLSLAELYHHIPEDLIISIIKLIGTFVILASINIRLTLIVFLFFPVMAFIIVHFNKKLNAALSKNKERIADINAQVEDSIAGIRVVKSFANEDIEIKKFARQNRRFLTSRKETYQSEALFFNGTAAFTHLITVAIVVFGGLSIVNETLDLADLITYLLFISNLIEPIWNLTNVTRNYQEGLTGFERFMEIIETAPLIQDAPNAVEIRATAGSVAFENVAFRYQEDHDYVLKDISMNVPAGQTVALVGSSGVGKTTLCSLIPRFYEASGGRVLLDGKDVRDISLRSLRRHVGVVQQDVYLFVGTVIDNIRYGKPDASKDEIIEAAIKANAHEFIMALPNGYDTNIGQRGVKLSGGQRQRLSIARAFLKNPPVLIFDEATSALDNESEKVVRGSLESLAKNRTTFVIAHRLSTIRNADRIIVLTEDGIGEQGTHEELMQLGGTYARFYKTS